MLIGFTASKLRTALVDTQILDEEKYLKSIIATVKDISNKGSYRQFLLFVEKLPFVVPVPRHLDPEKNTQIPALHADHIALDNIRILVRTKVEKGIRIGDRVKLSTKLFLPKIPPSEYAYDFARIAYYQKISATGFATSKVALHKKAKARKFQ
ncbi:hypothetical protein [Wolbachia endosymbiont of Mansonella ozzardi]|uniref:hypothetical protein n=1 Tax=Wolbachia endosymbiont of Mansonella ozzardi TaxID=137464 RepID=UPI0034CEA7DB